MTKVKKYSLIAVAAALCVVMILLGSLISTTRANLVQGNGSEVEVDLTSLDVKLIENGVQVNSSDAEDQNEEAEGQASEESAGSLLTELKGTVIDPGFTYDEQIAVKNTGNSPEYVRVVVRKYWTQDGKKDTGVKPETIQLLQDNEDWFVNEAESTAEQTVYYYRKALEAGETSTLLFGGVRLDPAIMKDFTVKEESGNPKVLKADFAYNALDFNVDAEAQSIQYKYADQAIPSAWGVNNLQVQNGELSLAD